ncbi:hypothetical protein PM10SUCC1_33270 [Propionigenium maris DSM 9537]|uniref:dihydrouracil dehydrogenase (NAD(+)) n=1 Tax=Propionigenium maris DSM 9537 TaxID=1123000 RepID=A0A9W6LPI6_9FUSO|nr:FAD-dependent oxidoreductase [Propionigenium maris]GLI57813.1 hypothetical protein PM10SUCC1_33270 [Propionigenium maris DSM 9537]
MKIRVLGDVNCRGIHTVESSTTLKDILKNNAGGMRNNRRLSIIQVGGILGRFLELESLSKPVEEFAAGDEVVNIMYLDELFCPVDYVKFLVRHCINMRRRREEDLLEMREISEKLVSEEGTEEDFLKLRDLTIDISASDEEKRFKDIVWEMTERYHDIFLEHVREHRCRTTICRRLYRAQCINACPAEVDIPGYVELMEHRNVEDAYRLMKKNNPLSFVCGKICPRPCEDRCRRKQLEETVGVRALQRYAADMTFRVGEFSEDRLEDKGRSVAIIGGGPAGLSAAYYLGRTGYRVTIFEENNVVGGMLATGIPEYRLPQATIDSEVEHIKNLGVEIKTGMRVGRDIELSQIRSHYDVVLLATGCQLGNAFAQGEGIETAVQLLKEVKVEGRREIGEKVLVVGGGDVAMDAARTALRMGAKKVMVATLEGSIAEMPATLEEKEEALEEGILFLNGRSVKEIHRNEDKGVQGVTLQRCLSVLDDQYNFSPVLDEEDTEEVEVDSLIFAIGQRPDTEYFTEDIEVDERGWVRVDPVTLETNVKGVFAAGDMSRVGTAVEAIAEGRRSAQAIDRHLEGSGLYTGKEITIPEVPLNIDIWNTKKEKETITVPAQRINFDEAVKTFDDREALCEARRCMRCDRNSRRRY